MVTVSKRAKLTFQTNSGNPGSFSIPHACPNKAGDVAEARMIQMIDLDILRLHNGIPTAPKSAAIVTTTTTDLL